MISGVQEAAGREQSANLGIQQDIDAVPSYTGDPSVPHSVPAGAIGMRPHVGQGGEDRRRLCGQLFQSRRARYLQRLYQQFLSVVGCGQTRIQTQIRPSRLPQGSFFLSPVWRPPTKLLSHRRSIGQADILARPAVVLWSHGQARPKISSIHPPTSGK